MKSSLGQNQKFKSINELKDELLKKVSQQQKPKSNVGGLNNSTQNNKNNNPVKSSSPDKSNIQPSQKKTSSSQQNNKANFNSNSNKKSIEVEIEPEPEVNVTSSTIDEIIEKNDDNTKTLEEFKQKFEEAFNTYSNENLSNEKETLQNNAKNLVSQLFKLQDEYYNLFNQERTENVKLKQLLVLYNQKYRTQLKKSNKIKEKFENNNIQNTLTLTINREENTRFKDMVNYNKTELSIFRKILKINYNQNDLDTFKEDKKLMNEAEEKKLLLKCLEKLLIGNQQALLKLSENKQSAIDNICSKYKVAIPEALVEEDPKDEEEEQQQPISTRENLNNENENASNNQESINKNENEDKEVIEERKDQEKVDNLDVELREFLVQFYLKKKISQVPFNRQGPGSYEYGTQKIYIKKDNDVLKVKVGNSYVLLERFIELNANSEEFKLMKYSKKNSLSDNKRGSTMAQRGSSTKTPTK